MQILNKNGEEIGAYYVGAANATQCRKNAQDHELFDILIEGLFFERPHTKAASFWDMRRAGGPTTGNLWGELSSEDRLAWLEVARISAKPVSVEDSSTKTFEMEGIYIVDVPGFYCALGEAINGPGGYFGTGLDSLSDCLRGGFGASAPFDLVWKSFEIAQSNLDTSIHNFGPHSYLQEILACFAQARVTVIRHYQMDRQ